MNLAFSLLQAASYDGQAITVWSIRLALFAWVLSLAILILDRGQHRWKINRLIWTAGCGLFVLHVVCAFGFVHNWSHANAWNETARQTAEVVGLDWGGGIYFNYLFTLIWILDVGWWWFSSASYNRRSVNWGRWIQSYFIFISFNAVVIFESGPVRWAGIIAILALGAVVIRARYDLE